MIRVIKENGGLITFTRGVRPATNEEKYEGAIRGFFGATRSFLKEMIICPSLLTERGLLKYE